MNASWKKIFTRFFPLPSTGSGQADISFHPEREAVEESNRR